MPERERECGFGDSLKKVDDSRTGINIERTFFSNAQQSTGGDHLGLNHHPRIQDDQILLMTRTTANPHPSSHLHFLGHKILTVELTRLSIQKRLIRLTPQLYDEFLVHSIDFVDQRTSLVPRPSPEGWHVLRRMQHLVDLY